MLAVFSANIQALVGYSPETYDGQVIYFGSDAEPPEYFRGHPAVGDDVFGWKRWLTGPLEVHRLTGDHHTILTGSHAQCIAERLREAVRIVNAPLPASETLVPLGKGDSREAAGGQL